MTPITSENANLNNDLIFEDDKETTMLGNNEQFQLQSVSSQPQSVKLHTGTAGSNNFKFNILSAKSSVLLSEKEGAATPDPIYITQPIVEGNR